MSGLPRLAHLSAVLSLAACSTTTSTLDCLSDPQKAPRSFKLTSSLDNSADPQIMPHSYTRPYKQVYIAVYIAALNAASLLSWDVEVLDPETGVIRVKTPGGLWTEGDKVTVRIARQDSATTVVDVTSGSDQAVEWGGGETNIRRFFERLDAGLGKPGGT